MYCFWVGKAVVHVPTGGVLKRIVTLPSAGDFTVVKLDAGLMGGGN